MSFSADAQANRLTKIKVRVSFFDAENKEKKLASTKVLIEHNPAVQLNIGTIAKLFSGSNRTGLDDCSIYLTGGVLGFMHETLTGTCINHGDSIILTKDVIEKALFQSLSSSVFKPGNLREKVINFTENGTIKNDDGNNSKAISLAIRVYKYLKNMVINAIDFTQISTAGATKIIVLSPNANEKFELTFDYKKHQELY